MDVATRPTEALCPLCQHPSQRMHSCYRRVLRTRQGEQLDDWIKLAKESGIPVRRSFAKGLLKGYDAVLAGMTLPWRQGQTEGQIQRLNVLKRQMFGRASFPVLRQRVLRRA